MKVKALFVLAGYEPEGPAGMVNIVSALNKEFSGVVIRFCGLAYPRAANKRAEYVRELGLEVVRNIFGAGSATSFCRHNGSPCVLADNLKTRSRGRCRKAGEEVSCLRERPQNLVLVCNERVRDELFGRFGRAALLFSYPGHQISVTGLAEEISRQLTELNNFWHSLNNLGSEREVAYLPLLNFQHLGGHHIADQVQREWHAIRAILENWRSRLYDSDFRNPRKRERRGGYRLTEAVYFQKDKLHTNSAHLGQRSRSDVFHLLNAYHLFGAAIYPDFQFDVMADDGRRLGTSFRDVLTGLSSDPNELHIDITPCDRVLRSQA